MAKLTDDQIRWILSLDAQGVQGELTAISSRSKELTEENIRLNKEIKDATKQMNAAAKEMDKLTKSGKQNSDAFKEASGTYESAKSDIQDLSQRVIANSKALDENAKKTSQVISQMKIQDMTMSQLKQRAGDLQKQLDTTSQAANPEAYKKLQIELNQLRARMAEVRAENALAGNTFGGILTNIKNLPGPVGSAVTSLANLGKAMWALVANPVGATIAAIVGSLMLLYKAFMSTDTGAVAFQSTLKSISNVIDVLIDRAMSYYKMLWSLVTFDFKGVKANAQDAFGGIGKALKDAASAGWNYAQTMDDIDDREASAAIRSAKLRDEIEKLKTQSKDVTKTARERIAIAQEAMNKEIELNSIEKGFLTERNDAETKNLASKIQNSKLTMEQKEAQLRQWLSVDDKELASLKEKDKAFADFVDKNEKEFQQLQKAKSDEFLKDSEFQKETRRLQTSMSTFKKELIGEQQQAQEDANAKTASALETAHNRTILQLTQHYSGQERLQKEFHARMLAEELAYLKVKAELEPDESKKLAIQTQIIGKQEEYTKAVREAAPEIMKNSSAREGMTKTMLRESTVLAQASKQAAKLSDDQNELTNKLVNRGRLMQETIGLISDGLYDMMSGSEDAFKSFAKNILIFALEQLKVQTELAVAGATIQSLSQPDSIATFGASGLARAAVLVGLIEAAFAVAEGAVNSAFSEKKKTSGGEAGLVKKQGFAEGGFNIDSGGYTGPGAKYEIAGILPNGQPFHRGEYFVAQNEMANPVVIQYVRQIESIRRQRTTANSLPGFADGGPTSGLPSPASGFPSPYSDPELRSAIIELNRQVKKGINAKVAGYGGEGSVADAMKQIANLVKNLGL